jgi:hypothetical protein
MSLLGDPLSNDEATVLAEKLKYTYVPEIKRYGKYHIVIPNKGGNAFIYLGAIRVHTFDLGQWCLVSLNGDDVLFFHEIPEHNCYLHETEALEIPPNVFYAPSKKVVPVFIHDISSKCVRANDGLVYNVEKFFRTPNEYIFKVHEMQAYLIFVKKPGSLTYEQFTITDVSKKDTEIEAVPSIVGYVTNATNSATAREQKHSIFSW